MNKFVQYRLPYLDDQGSEDAPGVHVRRFNGGIWPPFIRYINETRLLQFWPNSFWFKGNTYEIELVVTGPQEI
jgi:hypothetical protein